jgi:hypothetical protein
MNVSWQLDESEELDTSELLATILIKDNLGNRIYEEFIWLDSVLTTISEGLLLAKNQGEYELELFDDPYRMAFCRDNNNVEISWRGQKIVTTFDAAITGFKDTIKALEHELGSLEAVELTELRLNCAKF